MAKRIRLNVSINGIWEPEKKGDRVIGFFLDELKTKGEYKNTLFLIGKSDGSEAVGVNDYSVIQRAMERIPKNAFVQIVYNGMKQGKNNAYKHFSINAWVLSDDEIVEFDKKVSLPLESLKNSGSQSDPGGGGVPDDLSDDSDDDLPF